MTSQYLKLIDKLSLATQERKISWEKSSKENEYKVCIDNFMITVACPPELDPMIAFMGEKQYASLAIWNAKGEKIDEIKAGPSSDDYGKLSELYNLAKREFNKIDEALDSIISKI